MRWLVLWTATGATWRIFQKMPHLISLCLQVFFAVGIGRCFQRHSFHEFESVALESCELGWIVAHEPHARDAKIDKDLSTDTIVTQIGWKAQRDIGLHCIIALFLQMVCFYLIGQSDAATLVFLDVQNYAAPIFLYQLKGSV